LAAIGTKIATVTARVRTQVPRRMGPTYPRDPHSREAGGQT
jgi:hypothetical protein